MFCMHCGSEISMNVKFCPYCGKPLSLGPDANTPFYSSSPDQRKSDSMPLLAMIFGIAGIFMMPFILGTLGIIFGAICLKRGYAGKQRTMAKTGLICGIVGVAWVVIALFIGIAVFSDFFFELMRSGDYYYH